MKSQLFSVVTYQDNNTLVLRVIDERHGAPDKQIKDEGTLIMERLGLDSVIIQKSAHNGDPEKHFTLNKLS